MSGEASGVATVAHILALLHRPHLERWRRRAIRAALESHVGGRLTRALIAEALAAPIRGGGPAALAGNRAHRAIAAALRGGEALGLGAVALHFLVRAGLRVEEVEAPYCSPRLGYKGIIDCVARDDAGRLVAIEWKVAHRLHPEHFLQVAAYTQLVRAVRREPARGLVVRLSAEGYEAHPVPRAAYEAWAALLVLWKRLHELRRADFGPLMTTFPI